MNVNHEPKTSYYYNITSAELMTTCLQFTICFDWVFLFIKITAAFACYLRGCLLFDHLLRTLKRSTYCLDLINVKYHLQSIKLLFHCLLIAIVFEFDYLLKINKWMLRAANKQAQGNVAWHINVVNWTPQHTSIGIFNSYAESPSHQIANVHIIEFRYLQSKSKFVYSEWMWRSVLVFFWKWRKSFEKCSNKLFEFLEKFNFALCT